MIKLRESGIVYRNPKPHLKSIHAWHPSIVSLGREELLAAFDLGEAIESLDYRTYLSKSLDGGRTWSPPTPLITTATSRPSTHSVRLARMRQGSIVGFGGRFYRDDPNEGLTNRRNIGFVEMDLITVHSQDNGANWTEPLTIRAPVIGPGFEICHRIIELADGRWLAPTATWRGWQGDAPNGFQAIALVSHDQGTTWPDWISVVNQYDRRIISWEQGMTQLADGRILAVVWCYNESSGKSQPNRFVLSTARRQFSGRQFSELQFSEPRENGLIGETAKVITLTDGRVLCLYRRLDKPGLWANVVEIQGEQWVNRYELPIWQGEWTGMSGRRSASDELGDLRFGFPSMLQLENGEVLAVFWCLESGVHNIRWVRFEL